jgi:hypothetical protein
MKSSHATGLAEFAATEAPLPPDGCAPWELAPPRIDAWSIEVDARVPRH